MATQVEGDLKHQLRVTVMDWLSREYRLGHVYHDIWTNPRWLETLDADASNWMWRCRETGLSDAGRVAGYVRSAH